MWQYPTPLLYNWLTWILQESMKCKLFFKSKSCREMMHCALLSQYSSCLLSNSKEWTVSFWSLFHQTDKSTNEQCSCRVTEAHSLLADQTTVSLHSPNISFFPAFKSDPALSQPHASSSFSLSLSLFQLTVKRLVICNGNDTPWVKVTLCQNCILWFLPC